MRLGVLVALAVLGVVLVAAAWSPTRTAIRTYETSRCTAPLNPTTDCKAIKGHGWVYDEARATCFYRSYCTRANKPNLFDTEEACKLTASQAWKCPVVPELWWS